MNEHIGVWEEIWFITPQSISTSFLLRIYIYPATPLTRGTFAGAKHVCEELIHHEISLGFLNLAAAVKSAHRQLPKALWKRSARARQEGMTARIVPDPTWFRNATHKGRKRRTRWESTEGGVKKKMTRGRKGRKNRGQWTVPFVIFSSPTSSRTCADRTMWLRPFTAGQFRAPREMLLDMFTITSNTLDPSISRASRAVASTDSCFKHPEIIQRLLWSTIAHARARHNMDGYHCVLL